MNSFLISLFLLIFAWSCASTNKESGLDEEFKVVKEIPYQKKAERIYSERGGFFTETTDGLYEEPSNSDEIIRITQRCRDKRITEGLEVASNAYGQFKTWPTYWNAIGICYLINKDFYKAKLYFNRALEADKKYAPALNNLGLLLIAKSEWEASLLAFKSALKQNSRSQVVNYNLGRVYLAYGHGSKALAHFTKINDSKFYKEKLAPFMGVAHSLAGQHSKALEILESLYQEDSNNEMVRLFFAYSLKSSGKIAYAKKVIEGMGIGSQNPNYPLFYDLKRGLN